MKKQTRCSIRIFVMIAVMCAAIVSCSRPAFLGRDLAATRLSNYSIYLYNKGQYAEALPVAQNALSINEKVFGADHPYTAESLNLLAAIHKQLGDYEKAASLHKRALQIRNKTAVDAKNETQKAEKPNIKSE